MATATTHGAPATPGKPAAAPKAGAPKPAAAPAWTPAQDDAYALILNEFNRYGLGSLASTIMSYLRKGYSTDRVALELQNTAAYKQRFSGNDARLKAGLPVLSPAEYLATEDSYRQIMQQAGVPKGFYDNPTDFAGFIGQGVSPQEVQSRVTAATDLINKNRPEDLAYFSKYYSTGDMIAYALDPTRAAPLVGKQFTAASIGGSAAAQGLGIDRSTAETLAGAGINADTASQGFGQIKSDAPTAKALSSIYGENYDQTAAIKDVFLNDATAGDTRKRLASKERANFGNASAIGQSSLNTTSGGQV